MKFPLSSDQQKVVDFDDGPVLVWACPGAGKTRVLTERVRRLLSTKDGFFRVLALTFTNKAAYEMIERLSNVEEVDERTYIGTIHSFCTEILRKHGALIGLDTEPVILESSEDRIKILSDVLEEPENIALLPNSKDKKGKEKCLNRFLDEITSLKKNLTTPEMLEAGDIKRIYKLYNEELRSYNFIDFDDILVLTYTLFQNHPNIVDLYGRQFRYICVDEAQDLNEAQYEVVASLSRANRSNVMMVGDPNQSIFSFNGASPEYMSRFRDEFGAEVFQLKENFRSSAKVLQAAKGILPESKIEGVLPIEGDVSLIPGEDEEDEANQVINYLSDLVKNGNVYVEGDITWNRCAVMGRNRYVLSIFEKLLKERKIPYFKTITSQQQSESSIFQDFELCLRILANPRDMLHLNILMSRWDIDTDAKDIVKKTKNGLEILRKIREYATEASRQQIILSIEEMSWNEEDFNLLSGLNHLTDYVIGLNDSDEKFLAMKDIDMWKETWDKFQKTQPGGTHSLTTFLGTVGQPELQSNTQKGLALLTLHSAKGAEFDIVVIIGMIEGTFPDYRAKGKALDEEKRDAFVAVTRSRRLLALSYPKLKMMPWGSVVETKPSRYLRDMGLIT